MEGKILIFFLGKSTKSPILGVANFFNPFPPSHPQFAIGSLMDDYLGEFWGVLSEFWGWGGTPKDPLRNFGG